MKKLPKEIVVTLENEGTKDVFLAAYKGVDEAAEQGVKKQGAVYVLKQRITIECEAKVRRVL